MKDVGDCFRLPNGYRLFLAEAFEMLTRPISAAAPCRRRFARAGIPPALIDDVRVRMLHGTGGCP